MLRWVKVIERNLASALTLRSPPYLDNWVKCWSITRLEVRSNVELHLIYTGRKRFAGIDEVVTTAIRVCPAIIGREQSAAGSESGMSKITRLAPSRRLLPFSRLRELARDLEFDR